MKKRASQGGARFQEWKNAMCLFDQLADNDLANRLLFAVQEDYRVNSIGDRTKMDGCIIFSTGGLDVIPFKDLCSQWIVNPDAVVLLGRGMNGYPEVSVARNRIDVEC